MCKPSVEKSIQQLMYGGTYIGHSLTLHDYHNLILSVLTLKLNQSSSSVQAITSVHHCYLPSSISSTTQGIYLDMFINFLRNQSSTWTFLVQDSSTCYSWNKCQWSIVWNWVFTVQRNLLWSNALKQRRDFFFFF